MAGFGSKFNRDYRSGRISEISVEISARSALRQGHRVAERHVPELARYPARFRVRDAIRLELIGFN
jgi:hypothetical protein